MIALLLSAMALVGCTSSSSTEQSTLTSWTREAGLASVVQGIAQSVSATADDLKGLTSSTEDILKMANALRESGASLATQAEALAAEPASSDSAYEQQRAALIEAMRTYAATTAKLVGPDLQAITDSIKALTEISTSLTAFNTYVQEHGDDPVAAA